MIGKVVGRCGYWLLVVVVIALAGVGSALDSSGGWPKMESVPARASSSVGDGSSSTPDWMAVRVSLGWNAGALREVTRRYDVCLGGVMASAVAVDDGGGRDRVSAAHRRAGISLLNGVAECRVRYDEAMIASAPVNGR